MKRIFILTSHDNNMALNEANLGVTALLITAIESLKKYIPEPIFVTSGQFSRQFCDQYNLEVIKGRNFNYKVLSISETIKGLILLFRSFSWFVLHRYFGLSVSCLVNHRLLKELIRADIILVFIQDTFSDNGRLISIIDHAIEILSAHLLNPKIMIWNASIGPLRNSFRRKLGRYLFNTARAITLREKLSLTYLQEAGIDKRRLFLYPDTVFLLNPAPESHVKDILLNEKIPLKDRPLIGICVGREVPLDDSKGAKLGDKVVRTVYRILEYCLPDTLSYRLSKYAGRINSSSSAQVAKRECFAEIADYLVEALNANVVFVSHIIVPKRGDQRDIRDEREEAQAVFEKVKNKDKIHVLRGVYTTDEVKGIVRLFDLLIGMRMHICVAAVSEFVPTLAVLYNYKFYGMMEFLGQRQWVYGRISKEEIIKRIDNMWRNKERIRHELMYRVPQVKSQANQHAKKVLEILS